MNIESLNWHRLMSDLQETQGLSQLLIAAKFEVTQQYISCIMNGVLIPSKKMKPKILEWCESLEFDLNKYKATPSEYFSSEIKSLCIQIDRLKNRDETLDILNKMMESF